MLIILLKVIIHVLIILITIIELIKTIISNQIHV